MSFEFVSEWVSNAGRVFGTERRAWFFYALARMHEPDVVVEHGTGLGVSTLMFGQAAKENGHGHVYSFDNGSAWPQFVERPKTQQLRADPRFRDIFQTADVPRDYDDFVRSLGRAADLEDQITWVHAGIKYDFAESLHPDSPFIAPFGHQPIDVLFADVATGPVDAVSIVVQYLPLLADSASIFFDSAPTFLESYWVLERLVGQLQSGKIPRAFVARADAARAQQVQSLIAQRRFSLVHLVETNGKARQNSMSWLRVEPVDIVPYPLGNMNLLGNTTITRESMLGLYAHRIEAPAVLV